MPFNPEIIKSAVMKRTWHSLQTRCNQLQDSDNGSDDFLNWITSQPDWKISTV